MRSPLLPLGPLLLLLTGCSETFLSAEKAPSATDDSGLDSAEDTGETGDTSEPDTSDTSDTSVDTSDSAGDTDTSDTYQETGQDTSIDTAPVDADGDGWTADLDCDDGDADVNPDTPERWYDGIDQDCDGADDDQDGDGFLLADDCDDTDAAENPGAAETWYDGVDQDCDGNDNDQDGDGADVRTDCDDTDAAAFPGAAEVFYDGVDQACDGGDDYDQDADGDATAAGGGSDCDDTDASAYTGGRETLGDASDGDCDGVADSFAFASLDTFSGTGLQGPRISEMTGYVIVTFLADTLTYGATAMTTGAGLQLYDSADPWSGPSSDSTWEWGSSYTYDDGVDFWASDEFWIWSYGLRTGSTRYLVADAYNLIGRAWGATVYSRSTTSTFDDVEITEADDGTLHFLGCENQTGYLTWMHGTGNAVYTSAMSGADDVGGATGDACVTDPEDAYVLVSQRSSNRIWIGTYSDSAGVASYGTSSPWNAYDLEIELSTGYSAWAAAEGSSGVWVALDGTETTLPLSDARQVDVAMGATGTMYLAVTDGGADAYLYYGDPTAGFSRVDLAVGLPGADDIDVHVSDAGQVYVAVRDGDDIVVGVVEGA